MAGLHLNFFGSGRPLVALHGISGHGRRWRRLAERHLSGFRVIAPDLRGHGRSTHDAPWNVETHVADVLAAAPEGVFDLVGHSYGGLIALHLAHAAPERVRRLVLLDPALGIDPAHARDRARQMMAEVSYADPGEARESRAKRWPEAVAGSVDDEIDDHLEQGADGRWRWRFEPAAVVTAYSEMARPAPAPPPGVPTHLVVAARAGVVRSAQADAYRAAEGCAVTELDADHMLYLDRPEETGTLIRDWLNGS